MNPSQILSSVRFIHGYLSKWRITRGACQNAGSWAPSLDFQNRHPCGGGGRTPCAGDGSRTSPCCLFVAPPNFQPSTKPSLLLLPPREPFSPLHLGCTLALSPHSWAVLGGWLLSAPQIPNGEKMEAGGARVLLPHSPILSASQLSPLPGWPPVGAGGRRERVRQDGSEKRVWRRFWPWGWAAQVPIPALPLLC